MTTTIRQTLLAAALVAATALPAAAQMSTPELQREWLDLERRKVELLEQQQADREAQAWARAKANCRTTEDGTSRSRLAGWRSPQVDAYCERKYGPYPPD